MSNLGRTTSGSLDEPAHARSRAGIRRFAAEPFIALGLLVAGMWNLGGRAVWWDEGWTLSVARNWVDRGHYGRLLDGQLAPPGLQAAFPVTVPIALFMRLLGAGIWQGRVFGVLCMLAAFVLIYYLALRLYSRSVALCTIAVLLLTPMHPLMHALPMGRQVIAELPMLCYLLGAHVCLLLALRRSRWLLLPALLIGGVGLARNSRPSRSGASRCWSRSAQRCSGGAGRSSGRWQGCWPVHSGSRGWCCGCRRGCCVGIRCRPSR